MKLNELAERTYKCAVARGKTGKQVNHEKDAAGLIEEVHEFYQAKEKWESDKMYGYTQAQEELADVLIVCLTELYKRNVDIEDIVQEKIHLNELRKVTKK